MLRRFNILIIEDDPLIRERWSGAMSANDDCTVIEACNLAEARFALVACAPDLIVSDLRLPDGNAVNFLQEVRCQAPRTEILVISVLGDESTVISAIHAGASGYLLKDTSPLDIYSIAMDVLTGGSPMSPSIARMLVMRTRDTRKTHNRRELIKLSDPLSPREIEVLWSIARGFSYTQIALQLEISANTVPSHVKAIYRKLRVDNRTSAVYEAVQYGIIDL